MPSRMVVGLRNIVSVIQTRRIGVLSHPRRFCHPRQSAIQRHMISIRSASYKLPTADNGRQYSPILRAALKCKSIAIAKALDFIRETPLSYRCSPRVSPFWRCLWKVAHRLHPRRKYAARHNASSYLLFLPIAGDHWHGRLQYYVSVSSALQLPFGKHDRRAIGCDLLFLHWFPDLIKLVIYARPLADPRREGVAIVHLKSAV